jgi:ATP-dependent DNA helicase RecG
MHGRLKPAERRELMARFNARELDVLVATTVIEVGGRRPERDDHDRPGGGPLRPRPTASASRTVGRGAEQSYCLLISGPKEQLTESAHDRLEALVASTDGFELAEKDLEIRGGGALLGARQSGSPISGSRGSRRSRAAASRRASRRRRCPRDDDGRGRRAARRRRAPRCVLKYG